MSDDPSWSTNAQLLTQTLHSFQRKIGTIRRSTRKLLNASDLKREREKVLEITRAANHEDLGTIHESMQAMERFMTTHPRFNLDGVKLMRDAQLSIREYQEASEAFFRKCVQLENEARPRGEGSQVARQFPLDPGNEDDDDAGEMTEAHHLLAPPLSRREAYEQQLRQEVMAELERETQEIAENVRDVNVIFSHITQLVKEQGVTLETVDQNLTAAAHSTMSGADQLRRAEEHQNDFTRWKWATVILLVLILLVLLRIWLKK